MKKNYIILFFLMILSPLFSLSVGDFTVKYEKNGKLYNFYDDPTKLFQLLGEKNTLDEIGIGYSYHYNFKDCSFNVLSRKFREGIITENEVEYLKREFHVNDIDKYYNIDYFEAFQNFTTIRGVSIGDNIERVLEKYSEAVLYKDNGKYKWEVSDCYYETKIKKTNKLSDIGYVLLESANWQYNRSSETDFPMHYELVFVIKDCKVKSIVMQYVLDAL